MKPFEDIFGYWLRTAHKQAEKFAMTPKEWVRFFLAHESPRHLPKHLQNNLDLCFPGSWLDLPPSPGLASALRDEDEAVLSPACDEYKGLRAWLAEQLLEDARAPLSKLDAILGGSRRGGDSTKAKRRGKGLTQEQTQEAELKLREIGARVTNRNIGKMLGGYAERHVRRVRGPRKKRT
jgi:hypothetical protein